ncbi:DUF934 domain-containing protein [Acetobacteraceae bacterium ESL0709]|nr:DUF934 domain-containing protein [Acetobacteraceae bacterium ESL0697]MDF7678505.1 DUF934 domain-containing protein [Acetobacteraceae bacterium ESL0709]
MVSLADLKAGSKGQAVLLKPEEEAEELRPFMASLQLVLLQFPTFRDGRAFTQARTLREYLHFEGEIRVEGHILPDQADFLKRCGVDSVVLEEGSDPALWFKRLKSFSFNYQSLLEGS